TTVEYDDLQVTTPEVGADDVVRARVTVRNSGSRPALEPVQVYVSDTATSQPWADTELKAYRQGAREPGTEQRAESDAPASVCTLVDAEGRRVVEPGAFELRVGPSSRDEDQLRAGFTITG